MEILPIDRIGHGCLVPKRIHSIEISGTTFLYFYPSEIEHKNIYVGDSTVTEKFLQFCDSLLNNIDINKYYPHQDEELFYSELKRNNDPINSYFFAYNDSNRLLSSNKHTTLSHLKSFIMDYGFSGHWVCEKLNSYKSVKKIIKSEILKKDVEYNNRTFIHFCCANELLDTLFDIFMRYTNPHLYFENGNNYPRPNDVLIECIPTGAGLRSSITIGANYDMSQKKWSVGYGISTLYSFIEYSLITSTARKEYINKCPNCGNYFTTSNERAIYCSPTCRNRANVKRNYEKRKRGEINGND